jgi:hypothetical protein
MAKSNKWIAFVTKINNLTQEGEIRWREARGEDVADLRDSDRQHYGTTYVASLDDATLRIYKETIKKLNWEEEEYWEDDVAVELLTPQGVEFVRIPPTPGQEDLYETIRYKANKVDDFLENFLKDK